MSVLTAQSQIEEFRVKVETIPELPTLPHVLIHLNRLLTDSKTDAKQVGEVLSRDPALSSKVLKLANSAFYGMSSEISTISRATVVLGFDTIHSLALTTSVLEMFDMEDMGGIYFTAEEFWKHSIGTACITRMICKELSLKNAEEGWIAGLLHDIGKVVLSQYFYPDFKNIIAYVNEKQTLFINAEKACIVATHCNIGKWLVEKWALPPVLQETIALHHNPFRAEISKQMTSAVYIADILCRLKKLGNGGDDKIPALDKSIFAEIGLTSSMLKNIMAKIPEETEKAFAMMELIDD